MSYHRKFDDIAKQRILQMRRSGMPPKSIREMLRMEINNPSLQSKDIQNYISRRVGAMKQQDTQLLLDYFQQKQRESPDFVYKFRIDDQSRITDAFWIDADAKSLFKSFSGVVVFDTTYSVNAYKLPFAPFVGLDNNRISTLFGCALIQSETAKTLEWPFREWCLANDESFPTAIMTDQCPSMSKAIAEVFPQQLHISCAPGIFTRSFAKNFQVRWGRDSTDLLGNSSS
ncbi:hypothetical protein K3495_g13323 [Podosphaera aphanis]|nr:hypothetical protein K3495_g13323 [Podosphaera aphanis]